MNTEPNCHLRFCNFCGDVPEYYFRSKLGDELICDVCLVEGLHKLKAVAKEKNNGRNNK